MTQAAAVKKILIVDDEPDICKLISEGLHDFGYQVTSAYNGQQGLEEARLKQPDLIILDIFLPDIDGTVVYETLRRMPAHERTPVIFLTALAQGTKPQLQGISGTDYTIIPKPTNLEEIQNEIARLLG